MRLTIGQLFDALQLARNTDFYGRLSCRQINAIRSIYDILGICELEVEIPNEKEKSLNPFLGDQSLSVEDMIFITGADFSSTGVQNIGIFKKDGRIFVNKIPVEKMEYNGLQLRFEMSFGVYMIFDDDSCHYCHPPLPIVEMYEKLKA